LAKLAFKDRAGEVVIGGGASRAISNVRAASAATSRSSSKAAATAFSPGGIEARAKAEAYAAICDLE